MLIKSALLASLSGSMNGMTAARNRYGAYLRNRTIPVNPRTIAQESARDRMTQLVTAWRDALSASERTAWENYAANSPVTNRVGDRVYLTGLACYVRLNALRLQAGQARRAQAPTAFGEIALGDLSSAVTASATTANVHVDPPTGATWCTASGYMLVACSPPQPTSVNFYAGPFRYAASVDGTATACTVSNPYGPANAGTKVFVRVRAFSGDGRVTPPTIVGVNAA